MPFGPQSRIRASPAATTSQEASMSRTPGGSALRANSGQPDSCSPQAITTPSRAWKPASHSRTFASVAAGGGSPFPPKMSPPIAIRSGFSALIRSRTRSSNRPGGPSRSKSETKAMW